jgi:hypothetical protein
MVSLVLLLSLVLTSCAPNGSYPTQAPAAAQPSGSSAEQPAAGANDATPTPAPSGCKGEREPVGDYVLWSLPDCNKGVAVGLSAADANNTVVDLDMSQVVPGNNEFNLERVIINYEVQNEKGELVREFSQPMHIFIAYTKDDFDYIVNTYKDEPQPLNRLAFAYLDDDLLWKKYTQSNNGLTYVQEDAKYPGSFLFWDSKEWQPVTERGLLFDGGSVSPEELKAAFYKINTYKPERFLGMVFFYSRTWGDRYIGAGS